MPSFQEFEAHVAVDGEPLPEYSPKLEVGPDGIMTASCWVPSEAGKTFSIKYRDNRRPRLQATSAAFTVDGVALGSMSVHPESGPSGRARCSIHFHGPSLRGGYEETMIFSALELTDADSEISSHNSTALGELSVLVRAVVILGSRHDPNWVDRSANRFSTEQVHERSKKAGSGHPGRSVVMSLPSVISVCPRYLLFALAELRVARTALLRANDIAPPPSAPPSPNPPASRPTPHTEEIKPATNDVALSDTQRERLAALEAEIAQIHAASGASAAVKREAISHRGVFQHGDVIDLTED